jgi:hypothetical protein
LVGFFRGGGGVAKIETSFFVLAPRCGFFFFFCGLVAGFCFAALKTRCDLNKKHKQKHKHYNHKHTSRHAAR